MRAVAQSGHLTNVTEMKN